MSYKIFFILFAIISMVGVILSNANPSPNYFTTSNLTHTCTITPETVCVNITVVNKTCVDPQCLIYTGGNITTCLSASLTLNSTGNLTMNNSTGTNITSNNNNTSCAAMLIYPSNKQSCYNSSSWNKTVCNVKNVICTVNKTQCALNPVVYVGAFFNLKTNDGFGNIPAAELALKQINDDNTTLENVTLSLVAKHSTQSLLNHGTQILYNYLHSGPIKMMLLLPQEDDIARTVAAYAGLPQWGTLQFSYGTSDNSLASNKILFPRFFRLNPLTITYNRLRAAFVASFTTWKLDIALLYYADNYHEEVNEDLNQRLIKKGIKLVANIGFKSNPDAALDLLKANDAHIIIMTLPQWWAKRVFCKAFLLRMYGPHYVWITFNLMSFKFWIPTPGDNLECNDKEMTCVAENHFSFDGAFNYKASNLLINEPNTTFSESYNALVVSSKNRTGEAAYVYDSLWTIANILNRAEILLKMKGKAVNNLSYGEETELLERLAYETDFMGVTGRIRFYENGNRKFAMNVLQVRRDGYGYYVGGYNEQSDSYSGYSNILWQGGWLYQRTTQSNKWRNIEFSLFVTWSILAGLGIIYAIFCLVFVLVYRNERSIKYSSPTLNVIIIIGCLFNFITVVLYGLDYQRSSISQMNSICQVRLWLLSLGFTFCIGGLWVKVWTLFQILIERKVYRKQKNEYWMFGIVMVLLLIDVVYLIIWTTVDGLFRSFETVTEQSNYKCFEIISGNPFITSITYIETCDCRNLTLWSAVFITYKALLLLFGAYMSWKVRKVYTRKLVDAQYCARLLLLAIPFFLLVLIFAYFLRLYPTPHYALVGILILFYTFLVLGFLYGHKIINIFCCPRNMIRIRSSDNSGETKCYSRQFFVACLAPIGGCLAAVCCCVCCPFTCCKGLWDALIRGPRKNRGSFVKKNEKIDYQIGEMPGDKEKEIVILQRQVKKREKELKQLRQTHPTTVVERETQTMDYYGNIDVTPTDDARYVNEGLSDDTGNRNKYGRSGQQNFSHYKVFHRKLDFSHVGSKVDSGLENKKSQKTGRLPLSDGSYEEPRPGSNDSQLLLLQKTLSEREKELAQLRAHLLLQDTSSTIDLSRKVGNSTNIEEERNSGDSNAAMSSVAITIGSSDSDDESKMKGLTVNSDGSQRKRHDTEVKTTQDQGKKMGILPQKTKEKEKSEKNETKTEKNVDKNNVDTISKIYSPFNDIPQVYMSHYNVPRNSGKFKKTVQQLNAFRIFAKKPISNDKSKEKSGEPPAIITTHALVEDENTSEDTTKRNKSKPTASEDELKVKEKTPKSSSDVKIFNAPTNWSHVKSRIFNSNDNSLKPPHTSRRSSVKDHAMIGNAVKIFNSPSDYSHVKSRLFDQNHDNSEYLLKPSPNNLRRSKVGVEESDGSSNDLSQRRGSENVLRPNYRRKSKVDLEEDDDPPGVDMSKKRGNVKIFNAPVDYSHVKSRLFNPADGSFNRRSSQLSPRDIYQTGNGDKPKENGISFDGINIDSTGKKVNRSIENKQQSSEV